MPDFFNSNQHNIVTPLFGANYWIGFTFAFLAISSLFIFKNSYAKISKYNIFRYCLGGFQLFIYFLYFLFHQLSGDITLVDYFPFQLCSILDLTSGVLLILPIEKLFSMTLPLVAPVLLTFLLPDVAHRVYGLNNFFYYQYYFHHAIILFGYFYLYLYGHVKYNKFYFKQTIFTLVLFGALVYLFNDSFGTNYLFIGTVGYSFNIAQFGFDTGSWIPILRFGFMFAMGLVFLIPFHFSLVKRFKPYYLSVGEQLNPYYQNKKSLVKKFILKIKQPFKISSKL